MHARTAHDDVQQARGGQEDPTARASTTTVFMPHLSFPHSPASTSFVDDYGPAVPSPINIDATFELFSSLMPRSPSDMFTPLLPEHDLEHDHATQLPNLQCTSTTTSLPSHSHAHSRPRSTPSGTALPLATPAAPPTLTLDTLVLPAAIREEALPAAFRQQLLDARRQPCGECSAHGRACVQTNAASWKCRECMRMARGHCDWHVRTVEALGEEWTRPPVDMAARRRLEDAGIHVDRARDPSRPNTTRKRGRPRSSEASALALAPPPKKRREMSEGELEADGGRGGGGGGGEEEAKDEDEDCADSLFGTPPLTQPHWQVQPTASSSMSAPSAAGASRPAAPSPLTARRRRAYRVGRSTMSQVLERIADRVDGIFELLERISTEDERAGR